MLNQAAQKFIFMLEKNYHGFGGGHVPPVPPPLWIRHCDHDDNNNSNDKNNNTNNYNAFSAGVSMQQMWRKFKLST